MKQTSMKAWIEPQVVQLIDTIGVRHGLMLVGPTGGGKTCNYRLLQATSIAMCEAGDTKYQKVQTHILNPKSITQARDQEPFKESLLKDLKSF